MQRFAEAGGFRMWRTIRSVAVLTCAAVVVAVGFTTAAGAKATGNDGAGTNDGAGVLAEPVLLSLGKPVTTSSNGGCCPAANAGGGKTTTRWARGAGHDPQWIYVDLGATAQLSRVRLQSDTSGGPAHA